jgi:hypothetical protein
VRCFGTAGAGLEAGADLLELDAAVFEAADVFGAAAALVGLPGALSLDAGVPWIKAGGCGVGGAACSFVTGSPFRASRAEVAFPPSVVLGASPEREEAGFTARALAVRAAGWAGLSGPLPRGGEGRRARPAGGDDLLAEASEAGRSGDAGRDSGTRRAGRDHPLGVGPEGVPGRWETTARGADAGTAACLRGLTSLTAACGPGRAASDSPSPGGAGEAESGGRTSAAGAAGSTGAGDVRSTDRSSSSSSSPGAARQPSAAAWGLVARTLRSWSTTNPASISRRRDL